MTAKTSKRAARGDTRRGIVLVGGEKGGTGKTTLAVNLAVMLAHAGKDVLLVDTDTQGSASGLCAARDDAGIVPRIASAQLFGKGLVEQVRDFAQRYESIIIDAGGRDSTELRSAMVVADLFLSPLQATRFDLWTLKRMAELVAQVSAINDRLETLLVLNRGATTASKPDTEAACALVEEHGVFRLAKSVICNRNAYQRSILNNLGAIESTDQKAIDEITALYREVYGK